MKIGMGDITDRALYKEYMRRINAQSVLDYYGAENCTETRNRDGTIEVVHSCLLDRVEPHHSHGDQNPSASCNLEHKTYICYSYWGGSLLHLIARLERKDTVAQVIPLLGRFLDGATADAETFAAELDKLLTRNSPASLADLPVYSDRLLRPWSYIHPYLASRGITDDTASALQIGWDTEDNRIIFPHFWDGKLVGWQKRSLPPGPDWPATANQNPKYKNSPGFPKVETLYRYDPTADHLVVVESPMSVARAHSLGMTNVTATFGAKISEHQIRLLRRTPRITVWMDPDPAGQVAERKLVSGLWQHVAVTVAHSDPGMDLADYPDVGAVRDVLERAEPAVYAVARYDRQMSSRGR
jgi:hypothetical protein